MCHKILDDDFQLVLLIFQHLCIPNSTLVNSTYATTLVLKDFSDNNILMHRIIPQWKEN